MSGQQMTSPELNSVHDVKILLCYILDRLNRPVTEKQLMLISEDSEIINYFYFSDALEELIANDSVEAGQISSDGEITRVLTITEKGRLGSEYFNRSIPLVFRKKLLRAAFSFFIREQDKEMCTCSVTEKEDGCNVSFSFTDSRLQLMDMNFYAPDKEQAELIAEKIRLNPSAAYKKILGFLLDNSEDTVDVDNYL